MLDPPVDDDEPPSKIPGRPPLTLPPEDVDEPLELESPEVPEWFIPTLEPWFDPTFHEPDWLDPAFRLWPRLLDQFAPVPTLWPRVLDSEVERP